MFSRTVSGKFFRGFRLRAALAGLALLACAPVVHAKTDCTQPATVCDTAVADALALVDHAHPIAVLADAHDYPGVRRAARDLQSDLAKVAGNTGAFSTGDAPGQPTAIIVGTLGKSARIDRIVRERHIDTAGVEGRWEAYLLQVVDHPEPGIGRALLIAGADKRGTIFGIYELSRRIGVSPWSWWADVPVPRQAALYVAPGRLVDAPRVRYRGIFLNDEDPDLGGWMNAKFGGPNHRFYQHVFELILRLKGNTLWPAMWGDRAFADDDPQNAALADEYGVVIGTSHHEPMMRAHAEWQRYGRGPWDYTKNADALQAFWRRGIERMDGHESLVTIGMRGDGDEPMTQGTAIGLLERIVADQRRIISEVTGQPAAQTPQVWALYKEVQDYFDAGMRVPDDVTLLFSDDNWGNLRRLPKPGEVRQGGYGIYYHFDYVGGPRNYKWVDSTQIERVWEQMRLASAYGANQLWMVNVGDIKPLEFPISFFLDVAWNPQAMTAQRLAAYPADWAAGQFGPRYAAEIGELLTRYTQYNARRKPELLSPDTWSLTDFHEAARVEADWNALATRAQRIGAALPTAWHDAWYELVGYPILASANLNALYIAAARNREYAAQGRASTNGQAALTQRLFARDAELARVYEQDIAGGKWTHMMEQTHIGYTGWQQPAKNVIPATLTLAVPDKAAMGVAVEGDARAWPGPPDAPRLPPLAPFGADTRDVTVFNRGATPFHYTAGSSQPWLRVTPASGEVADAQTLRMTVDWNAVPDGTQSARLTLRGSEGSRVDVTVPVEPLPHDAVPGGFVESAGHIAIEAPHHTRAVAPAGLAWQTIPNLGRTLGGVTSTPATAPATPPTAAGAWLEYPIWLRAAGEITVRVRLSPSLDFLHRGGLRYAVSIDDEPPQVATIALDPEPGHPGFEAWNRAVSDAVYTATSQHQVARAGAHTLKLWRIDPGVVFQRVELYRGTPDRSYLGPPESTYLPVAAPVP
ncbi:glycosyl hydrolase 115 family protein [Rhodanobacter sp. Si-c]|uniref:Glycosyl hydrolase 115 family protein n=1 Tax=Rhodanobacter lycopersici TaxID=3162487 RepID=A0ABV3QDI0_9GAMM